MVDVDLAHDFDAQVNEVVRLCKMIGIVRVQGRISGGIVEAEAGYRGIETFVQQQEENRTLLEKILG